MSHVQSLAYSVFMRILLHDVRLNVNACSHHVVKFCYVAVVEIEIHELRPDLFVADKPVFNHFCVSGKKIAGIERA